MAHSPGSLKVEASRDGIYIKDLAGKIEAGMLTAFESSRIDAAKRHASTRDELLFIGITAVDAEVVVGETRCQTPAGLAAQSRATEIRGHITAVKQVKPQPVVELYRPYAAHPLLWMGSSHLSNELQGFGLTRLT